MISCYNNGSNLNFCNETIFGNCHRSHSLPEVVGKEVRFLPVGRGAGIFIIAAHRGAGVRFTAVGKSHDRE